MDVHQEKTTTRLEISCLISSSVTTAHARLTLYTVHLDPLANIHDLDERSFFRRYRFIYILLIPDSTPVVRNRSIGVPSLVLSFVELVVPDGETGEQLTSGEDSFTERIFAVMISS